MSVFVTPSAIVALADSADVNHARALELLGHLEGPLVTSNLAILGTARLAAGRGGHRKAAELLERLRHEAGLKIYHVDAEIEQRGWEIFARHTRGELDPADAMNFALMRELGVRMAFTFEASYRDAGFVAVPVSQG